MTHDSGAADWIRAISGAAIALTILATSVRYLVDVIRDRRS